MSDITSTLEIQAQALIAAATASIAASPGLPAVSAIAVDVLAFIRTNLIAYSPSSYMYEIMDKADTILADLDVLLSNSQV